MWQGIVGICNKLGNPLNICILFIIILISINDNVVFQISIALSLIANKKAK